ncbi:MAG: hypothetical protein PHX70_10085 [Clostridium sp.]|nr:hypothetical protein [Clostridium sp.]
MQKRNSFITFLASLIPGAGYMYFGMLKKGAETMVLFFLFVELGHYMFFPMFIITCPLWFYTFFDTYRIAHKVDRGEVVSDESISNIDFFKGLNLNNSYWSIIAAILIIIGVLSICNNLVPSFYIVVDAIRSYFVPGIFIILGIYILYRSRK